MIDMGIISLTISGIVGAITILNFLSNLSTKKEAREERFAKADLISKELDGIKNKVQDLNNKVDERNKWLNGRIEEKIKELNNTLEDQSDKIATIQEEINDTLEDQANKISTIQIENAVCHNERHYIATNLAAHLKELEKLNNKLDNLE